MFLDLAKEVHLPRATFSHTVPGSLLALIIRILPVVLLFGLLRGLVLGAVPQNLLGQPHVEVTSPLLVLQHLQIGGIFDFPVLNLLLPASVIALLDAVLLLRLHVISVLSESILLIFIISMNNVAHFSEIFFLVAMALYVKHRPLVLMLGCHGLL